LQNYVLAWLLGLAVLQFWKMLEIFQVLLQRLEHFYAELAFHVTNWNSLTHFASLIHANRFVFPLLATTLL
jgi:hypothetical protein